MRVVLEVDVGALNRGLEKAIAGARYLLHPVATGFGSSAVLLLLHVYST
jgi:hypothetical protein